MKKILHIICLFVLLGCNSENSNNCIQKPGDSIEIEIEVPSFEKVTVHEGIELIITQGDTQKVLIKTAEKLVNDITVEVINNELILKNYNTCSYYNESKLTKIYVTAPNLTRLRNASELKISSNGVISYPSIELVSIGDKEKFLPIGDFHLTIQNESLKISSNGLSNFHLEGATKNLNLNFFDLCDSRFEGKNFIAQHILVNQISSNDLLIFPVESVKGAIYSTGDVLLYNTPTIIDITEISGYGKLIIK